MMRNSVLEELRVRRFADIQDISVVQRSGGGRYLSQSYEDGMRKKLSWPIAYHLHKGGGQEKVRR